MSRQLLRIMAGTVFLYALAAGWVWAGVTSTVLTLPFAPMKPTDASSDCPTPKKLSASGVAGATKKTTFQTVATMFFNQSGGGPSLAFTNAYQSANFVVLCRGAGQIRVVKNNCATVVATIDCEPGGRPWTTSSAVILLPSVEDFDVQVKADPGETLEWANPLLVLF